MRTCSASPGEPSEERSWEEIAAVAPDIVIVMPCGYDAEIAHREAEMHRDELLRRRRRRVVAVDAAAYFSRPGPRIIDGLELLASIIHPELVPEPPRARADRRAADADAAARVAAQSVKPFGVRPVPPATAIAPTTLITADQRAAGERDRLLAAPLVELDDATSP